MKISEHESARVAVQDVESFQQGFRTWLEANAPADAWAGAPRDSHDVEASRDFQRALFDAGYAGITWPRRWGGLGLTDEFERAFSTETARRDLPLLVFIVGLGMCVPTILELGTDAQRERYLLPALRGEEIWSLLTSEPVAGSDVAGIRTKAVRVEGGYRITGQKVWTTAAQYSERGLLLARTDTSVAKHAGLTVFLIDLRAAGVQVRPLRDVTGDREFNEVFLDDVFVPDDDVLGSEGDGWRIITNVFEHERRAVSVGTGSTGQATSVLDVRELARRARDAGTIDDIADDLVDHFIHERVSALLNAELGDRIDRGDDPGPLVSLTKLLVAENTARAGLLAVRALGTRGILGAQDSEVENDLAALSGVLRLSLGGGTNEIQRDIIGDRVLNLPREPRADRGPFAALAERERGEAL